MYFRRCFMCNVFWGNRIIVDMIDCNLFWNCNVGECVSSLGKRYNIYTGGHGTEGSVFLKYGVLWLVYSNDTETRPAVWT
jgi:hypothetical protein